MRARWIIVLAALAASACGGGGGGGGNAASSPVLPSTIATAAPPSPTPSSAPVVASGAAPAHIPTWAFDEYGAQGAAASASLVQTYVSYAQGGYGNAKAHSDCDGAGSHPCQSVFYFDPNFVYASISCASPQATAFLAAADETWFVHESGFSDAAHRVSGTFEQACNGATESTPVYLADENNPAVDTFFANYMQSSASGWDLFVMDDTSASVLTQAYGPGGGFCANAPPNSWCTATAEYPTDASVVAGHVALLTALGHAGGAPLHGVFNGVGFGNGATTNLNLIGASGGALVGAVCENCIINAGVLQSANYERVLNAMAAVDAIPGASFLESNTGFAATGSADQVTQRLVTTAIAWLGFAPGQTIVAPNLEDKSSDLAIWPEDSLYPAAPVQSMASGAADIAVATGVWRREFADCSLGGSAIGACAAVVNGSTVPVTIAPAWLKQAYAHLVTLVGGDIESGGSVSLTQSAFAPTSTTIAPGAAVLLVH